MKNVVYCVPKISLTYLDDMIPATQKWFLYRGDKVKKVVGPTCVYNTSSVGLFVWISGMNWQMSIGSAHE